MASLPPDDDDQRSPLRIKGPDPTPVRRRRIAALVAVAGLVMALPMLLKIFEPSVDPDRVKRGWFPVA